MGQWKKPRLTLSQLEKDIPNGGGGGGGIYITIFDLALKLSWISLLVSNNGDWHSLYEVASNLRKEEIWSLDFSSLGYIQKRKIKNVFWKDVISAWLKYKGIYIDNIDITTYPIWNSNKNLKRKAEL